eukprot:Colp12_sorted_trinity150504_noHs@29704
MTIKDFINKQNDDRNPLLSSFTHLAEVWNALRKLGAIKAPMLEESSPLISCCFQPKEKESPLFVLLQKMAGLQNNFLQQATALAAKGSVNASFLRAKKSTGEKGLYSNKGGSGYLQRVELVDVKAEQVVAFEWDDNSNQQLHKNLALPVLEYGPSNGFVYDFAKIESELMYLVLVGKATLGEVSEFPHVLFANELFLDGQNPLSEVRQYISQSPLTDEQAATFKTRLTTQTTERLLTVMGVVIAL